MNPKHYMNTPASVYVQIRDAIVNGTYASGAPLKQDKIASDLGVSKIPVREALVLLEADGFVETFPGRGAIVAPLSVEEAQEIYLMRAALEPILLAYAIPKTPTVEWLKIEGILAALGSPDLSFNQWHQLDYEFHTALYQHAGLSRIQKTVSALHGNMARYYAVYMRLGANFRWQGEQEHRAILEACQAGDVKTASQLLQKHLGRSSYALMEALQAYMAESEAE